MSIATITSKGQVTIPKEIRDRFGLREGDRLEFIAEDDGTIRLRRKTVDLLDVIGFIKPGRHATLDEMQEAIARGWSGE